METTSTVQVPVLTCNVHGQLCQLYYCLHLWENLVEEVLKLVTLVFF